MLGRLCIFNLFYKLENDKKNVRIEFTTVSKDVGAHEKTRAKGVGLKGVNIPAMLEFSLAKFKNLPNQRSRGPENISSKGGTSKQT